MLKYFIIKINLFYCNINKSQSMKIIYIFKLLINIYLIHFCKKRYKKYKAILTLYL